MDGKVSRGGKALLDYVALLLISEDLTAMEEIEDTPLSSQK